MKKFLPIIYFFCLAFVISSCTTVPKKAALPSSPGIRTNKTHIVAPGETFWRISKMYNVPLASILKANALDSSSTLKMGQKLFIPQATAPQPVISLYPSNKWKYIIIHHSATEAGSSLAFNRAHLNKGWDGVGYHFVIDKHSSGKQDGQIELTPRWIKQLDGAHCKASEMNSKAIGICLVGNFNHDRVSYKQMESLIYLVNTLKEYYRIPDKNILGHGHVHGALTDCPGKKFPWWEFKSKIVKY